LSADAAHLLLTYNWPGNVRELDNLLQRALILVNGPVIGPEHIQFELLNEPIAHAQPAHVTGHVTGNGATAFSNALSNPLAAPYGDTSTSGTYARLSGVSLASSLGEAEKDMILDALRSGSPRREVAERLGISPRTLRHKLARLREAGVEVPAA
jgi:two-component system response regulator FlrC